MKLTNLDIFASARRAAFQKILNKPFPVAISFKLAKMAQKLDVEFEAIEKVKNGLVTKYGVPNEKGQMTVTEDSPNFEKFVGEFNELMAMEVELVIEKVKLPEQVDGKPLELEPSLLMALGKFVEV